MIEADEFGMMAPPTVESSVDMDTHLAAQNSLMDVTSCEMVMPGVLFSDARSLYCRNSNNCY